MGLEACWCFHSAASCLSPTGHRPAGWQKCRNFGLCCLPACELPKKHCNLQVLVMGTWTLDPFAQRNHRGGLLTYPRSPSNRWLPWDWKPGPKCQFSWFSQIPSLPTLPLTFFFFFFVLYFLCPAFTRSKHKMSLLHEMWLLHEMSLLRKAAKWQFRTVCN